MLSFKNLIMVTPLLRLIRLFTLAELICFSKSQTFRKTQYCREKVINMLKEIKNKNQINEDQYNKLRPVGKQPGVLDGEAKNP